MIKKAWVKFRNIKIVKFSDDEYGIRKGWIIYRYKRNCSILPWCFRPNYEILKGTFDRISKEYEKRFVDEGEIVSYTRTYDDK